MTSAQARNPSCGQRFSKNSVANWGLRNSSKCRIRQLHDIGCEITTHSVRPYSGGRTRADYVSGGSNTDPVATPTGSVFRRRRHVCPAIFALAGPKPGPSPARDAPRSCADGANAGRQSFGRRAAPWRRARQSGPNRHPCRSTSPGVRAVAEDGSAPGMTWALLAAITRRHRRGHARRRRNTGDFEAGVETGEFGGHARPDPHNPPAPRSSPAARSDRQGRERLAPALSQL
jgi:hypothetical protein